MSMGEPRTFLLPSTGVETGSISAGSSSRVPKPEKGSYQ